MKRIILVSLAMLCSAPLHATNFVKIINKTSQSLKVGLYKSLMNFAELRVDAGATREYETGQEQACLKRVTINGTEIWSGSNCDNYEITITKESNGSFALEFTPSNYPKPAPFDPSQGISM